jgi:hypothetical protein
MLALQNSYLQGGFFGNRTQMQNCQLNRTTDQRVLFSQNFDQLEKILEKRSSEAIEDLNTEEIDEPEINNECNFS